MGSPQLFSRTVAVANNSSELELYALSQIQEAIWYDLIARPYSAMYNIGGRLMIYGHVDYALLKQALQKLVDQNDALRLAIDHCTGSPIQFVRPHLDVDLPLIDVSNTADPEAEAVSRLQAQFNKVFAIGKDAVYWQFALIKIRDDQYALLTKYHHLIADGWSTKVVIDRLAALYNALLLGDKEPRTESSCYLDFVEQERQYVRSVAYKRDAEFWQQQLPILPEPLIIPKYPVAGTEETIRAHVHRFYLDRTFYDNLGQWANERQATTYHLLLCALCLYFARTQQRSNITVGIPALNRSGARFKKVLGLFASLSPLAIDVDPNSTPHVFLQRFSFAIRKLHKHQRYPLSAISQRLQLLKHKRESLFDLVMSYEKQDYSVHFGAAKVNARQLFSGVAHYPLAVTVCEFSAKDDVEIIFEGAETCFNPKELALLGQRLQFILRQFIENPDIHLSEIDLMPDEEKQFIFSQFNRPQPKASFYSVITQFRRWVENSPDALALKLQRRVLSYRELDSLSNQLAKQLFEKGCKTGDIVAVCMPRCIESIISLLAILKIRAVYLPIDCDSPIERIQTLLQQSRTSILLATTSGDQRLCDVHDNTIWVDRIPTSPDTIDMSQIETEPEDLAYLMYTSGSTGQPKGVKIHHLALLVRLAWLQKAFGIKPGDKVGQTVQMHFDPSLIEILLALTQGGCLVLAPWQRLTAEALAEFVIKEQINALALVPSSLRLLLQGLPDSAATSLRVACCGGETLPAKLAKAFLERIGAQLFNVYGPTETTILAAAWPCSMEDSAPLPLGLPLDYTQIFIVDSRLKLLPVGVSGEIAIGGAGVGKGYFQQQGITERAFVANPYSEGYLYRTGDVGYIGSDGLLYFSERLDRQVKISGFRIEPAEIENVMMQHPGVRRAAVSVVSQSEQKTLVAYVEPVVDQTVSLRNELSTYLRHRLPDYMQPRTIMLLKALPSTAAGKIAYKQLPLPDISMQPHSKRSPANALEARLLKLWRQALNNPELGIEDNFFEQNTDSLTAINLLAALEVETGQRHSIAFLMAYPSVALQAEQLMQKKQQLDRSVICTLTKQLNANHLYLAASGEGDRMRFQALADVLEGCCSLSMLLPPPLESGQASIEAIARVYAEEIRKNQEQNVYLAGFSIGGITALETAYQLERQGQAPKQLILLDTVYPRWPLQSTWLLKFLQWLSGRLLLDRITLNDRKLQAMLTDPGIITQLAGLNRHVMHPFGGPSLLVETQGLRWLRLCLYSGWFKMLGNKLTTATVPGLHGAMFKADRLPALSQVIKHALSQKQD